MPKRTAAPAWQQLQMQITCPKQYLYELIRPVVLTNHSVADRAIETGMPDHVVAYHVDHFRANGLPGIVAAPPPLQRAARLPDAIIAFVLALKAEHPPLKPYELASICYVRFGRRPNVKTIKRLLTLHPLPQLVARRFPPYHAILDPFERRRAILRLSLEGWTKKSIAAYLQMGRTTVHDCLKRWDTAGLDGLHPRSSAPHRRHPKATLAIQQRIRRLQRNPLLGAWRMHAALRREGIRLSPRTCGRIMAVNRDLYAELRGTRPPRPRQPRPMPFAAAYRHQWWTIDIRYLDMHRLGGGHIYCISILENYSRAIVASAISRIQDTTAVLKVLYDAIAYHGCPEGIVSDSGSVFRSERIQQIYQHLGIQRRHIEKRQPWQSYIETTFFVIWNTCYSQITWIMWILRAGIRLNRQAKALKRTKFHIINIQRRMMDEAEDGFRAAQRWDALWQAHDRWVSHYNTEAHWAHRDRHDDRATPAEVLAWVGGRPYPARTLQRIFAATRLKRRLDRVGFLRVRRWRIYSEIGLAKEAVEVWLEPHHVTITYADIIYGRIQRRLTRMAGYARWKWARAMNIPLGVGS